MANIVHVLTSFKVGGAERFVLDLAKVQSGNGDFVEIFSCDASEQPLLLEAKHSDCSNILSLGSRWKDYCALLKRLKLSKECVFQMHSPWALRYFLPLLPLLFLARVKIIYTRHGLNPLVGESWGLVHYIARPWVHMVTFVSQAGLDVFYKRFGWAKSRLMMISNGVLIPEHFECLPSDKIRLGSVGRMVGLKGQVHMIESVSQLDDVLRKSVEIHFFGDGPELSTLKSLVEEKSIAEQTVFHGMELNRDKVFNCIDILVVCSEQEGLSLAIMEAMARSIPVIATNVGDTPKLVLNEQTGYLYEYGGVDELISYLTELCSDKDTQKRLGMNARAHMIEGFSLEKANDTYQSCYRSKN